MKPTALIADDEPLLAEDLRRRLARLWPELDIVAVCHDGPAALARLGEDRPEIAFLDIRMPGLTGLEVAARLDYPCQLVFVTAYDQHAVEAFDLSGCRLGKEFLVRVADGLEFELSHLKPPSCAFAPTSVLGRVFPGTS